MNRASILHPNATKKIKDLSRQFASDPAGERFMNLHRRLHSGGHRPLFSVIGMLADVVLIVVGIFLALIPGVPGIVLGIPGVALIAAQIPLLAKWCDRWEIILRTFFKKQRQKHAAALKRKTASPLKDQNPYFEIILTGLEVLSQVWRPRGPPGLLLNTLIAACR